MEKELSSNNFKRIKSKIIYHKIKTIHSSNINHQSNYLLFLRLSSQNNKIITYKKHFILMIFMKHKKIKNNQEETKMKRRRAKKQETGNPVLLLANRCFQCLNQHIALDNEIKILDDYALQLYNKYKFSEIKLTQYILREDEKEINRLNKSIEQSNLALKYMKGDVLSIIGDKNLNGQLKKYTRLEEGEAINKCFECNHSYPIFYNLIYSPQSRREMILSFESKEKSIDEIQEERILKNTTTRYIEN